MLFLKNSAAAFDAGMTAEAARLAVTIRVLAHDKGRSRSLLSQLGLRDSLVIEDTALDRPAPDNAYDGLTFMRFVFGGEVRFLAPLGDRPPQPLETFDGWWNAVVIRDQQNQTFTRSDLVLALANKEGGAHVDPELDSAYVALARNGSLGWVLVSDTGRRPLLESPVPACVRQIAYELDRSIREQAARWLRDPSPDPDGQNT